MEQELEAALRKAIEIWEKLDVRGAEMDKEKNRKAARAPLYDFVSKGMPGANAILGRFTVFCGDPAGAAKSLHLALLERNEGSNNWREAALLLARHYKSGLYAGGDGVTNDQALAYAVYEWLCDLGFEDAKEEHKVHPVTVYAPTVVTAAKSMTHEDVLAIVKKWLENNKNAHLSF